MKTNAEINKYKTNWRKFRDEGLYARWKLMRKRCYNTNHPKYKYYGAKGIGIEWETYQDFKSDMYESYIASLIKNGRENTTIERLDSSKSYSFENCKWATLKEQHLTQGGRGRAKETPPPSK